MKNTNIQVGDKFYDCKKTKHHIVNVFTDNNEEIVTYKFWNKGKQRWYYKSEVKYLFIIAFDFGYKWIKSSTIKSNTKKWEDFTVTILGKEIKAIRPMQYTQTDKEVIMNLGITLSKKDFEELKTELQINQIKQ